MLFGLFGKKDKDKKKATQRNVRNKVAAKTGVSAVQAAEVLGRRRKNMEAMMKELFPDE